MVSLMTSSIIFFAIIINFFFLYTTVSSTGGAVSNMNDNHMHTLGGLAALAGILLLFLLALGTLTIVVAVVLRQRITASKS